MYNVGVLDSPATTGFVLGPSSRFSRGVTRNTHLMYAVWLFSLDLYRSVYRRPQNFARRRTAASAGTSASSEGGVSWRQQMAALQAHEPDGACNVPGRQERLRFGGDDGNDPGHGGSCRT